MSKETLHIEASANSNSTTTNAILDSINDILSKKNELTPKELAIEIAKCIDAPYTSEVVITKIMALVDGLSNGDSNFNTTLDIDKTLDELLPISDDMLAVPGHTRDMFVLDNDGNKLLIYDHLEIFKERLLRGNSENKKLRNALADTSEDGLKQKIRKIKLHFPQNMDEEKSKNIEDRTAFMGDETGNGGSTKTGVPGVPYVRNEGFTQNVPVKQIIHELQGYGLSKADAVSLFVVIAGLPKAGFQESNGMLYDVGLCGYFAYSAVRDGEVEYLGFNDDDARLTSDSASDAISSLSN